MPQLPESLAPASAPACRVSEYTVMQMHLAAFLLTCGHRLIRLEPVSNGARLCKFIFERDARIAEDRMRFFERQTTIDALTYAEVLAGLKKRAKEKLKGENMNAKQYTE